MNRAQSGSKATGNTRLDAQRRNHLLLHHPEKTYVLQYPGNTDTVRETVRYEGFHAYEDDTIAAITRGILDGSAAKEQGVVVTASILTVENYAPVIEALNVICDRKDGGEQIGKVYLVACENTVSARDVLQHDVLRGNVSEETRRHVQCVHALVDRMCVGLEEYPGGALSMTDPTVSVRAEEFGSLRLALEPETAELAELLQGTKAEFSKHLDVEKEIKGWLLNGSHWLIALTAFHETGGNPELKLNEFLQESPEHHFLAAEILLEIRDGIEILLRSEPKYHGFVEDMNVSRYLDEAVSLILERFRSNEDTIARILARFRTPSQDEVSTIQSFTSRLLGRVDPPMAAYQREWGVPPRASTQSLFNLFRLEAAGTFVDGNAESRAA